MRVLAAAADARAAVEISTGSGVGSLYLLAGMNRDGVLTTIDPEVENQRAAREAFAEAKIRTPRVRTIAGQPREVVRRLTDHAYDLVSFPAHRVHDRCAAPATRAGPTRAVRELLTAMTEAEDLVAALTGSGDGVLTAVLRP